MTYDVNDTHDPELRSWVEAANEAGADFPIQNLPFGMFTRTDDSREDRYDPRVGVAIGDSVLDLITCARERLFDGLAAKVAAALELSEFPELNDIMWLGHDILSA